LCGTHRWPKLYPTNTKDLGDRSLDYLASTLDNN
jgi:hypothetical protein